MIKNIVAKSRLSHESFMFVCSKWDQVGNGHPDEVALARAKYLEDITSSLEELVGSNCDTNLVTLSKAHKSVWKENEETNQSRDGLLRSFAMMVSAAIGFQMEPLYHSVRQMIALWNSFLSMIQHKPCDMELQESARLLANLWEKFPHHRKDTLGIADSIVSKITAWANVDFNRRIQETFEEIISRLESSSEATAHTAEALLKEILVEKFNLWFRNDQRAKDLVLNSFEECREHLFLFDSQIKAVLNHLGIANDSMDHFWNVFRTICGFVVLSAVCVVALPIAIPFVLLYAGIDNLKFSYRKEAYVTELVQEMRRKYKDFTLGLFHQIPEYKNVEEKLKLQESHLKLLQNYVKGISTIQARNTSDDLHACRVLLDKAVIAMVSVHPKTYDDSDVTCIIRNVDGGGNGNISSAVYRDTAVAIKTIKCADVSNITTFYNEVNVMRYDTWSGFIVKFNVIQEIETPQSVAHLRTFV